MESLIPVGRRPNPRSCNACHRRKVRCDRQQPCGNCTRAFEECIFPHKPITRIRSRRNAPEAVEQTTRDVENEPDVAATIAKRAAPIVPPPPLEDGESLIIDSDDKSRLLATNSWAAAKPKSKELEASLLAQPMEALCLGTRKGVFATSPNLLSPYCANCLGSGLSSAPWRPNMLQLEACWHIYVESVDPVVRLIHKPSVRKLIDQVLQNGFEAIEASSTALLLVICFTAIISMTDWRCEALFNTQRANMIRESGHVTEVAFQELDLTRTHSFSVLQAYVLYLSCKPRDSSRSLWTLVGLAIRIAVALGLHRDGSNYKLLPFQTEMRRRVWWQLVLLEVRTSEDYSSRGAVGLFKESDTAMPLNLNDVDFSPEMKEMPVADEGIVTEMSFTLLRCAICCALIDRPGLLGVKGEYAWTQDKTSKSRSPRKLNGEKFLTYLQTQFINRFDRNATSSMYRLGSRGGNIIMAKLRLQAGLSAIQGHDDASKGNDREKALESLLGDAIELLEAQNSFTSDPLCAPFRWIPDSYVQWHAATFVLSQLYVRLERLAKQGQISTDEEAMVYLDDMPPLLRRAYDATETMFDAIGDADECERDQRWGLLQKVRQMSKQKIYGEGKEWLNGVNYDSLEMDWSNIQLDNLWSGIDVLYGFNHFSRARSQTSQTSISSSSA